MKSGVNNGPYETYSKNKEKSLKYNSHKISVSKTVDMATLVHVKIPSSLIYLSREIKNYCAFYLLLKAHSPLSGWIIDYPAQVPTLCKNIGLPKRLFLNYMKKLKGMQLAFQEGNKIRLVGFKQFGRLLSIDAKNRTEIPFQPGIDKFPEWTPKNLI